MDTKYILDDKMSAERYMKMFERVNVQRRLEEAEDSVYEILKEARNMGSEERGGCCC